MKDNTGKVLIGLILLLTMTALLGLRKQSFSVPVAPEAAQVIGRGNTENNLKQLFYDQYTSLVIATDGKKIDPGLPLADTNLKAHTLLDLTQKKDVLVFRYSYKDCDVCVGSVLKILRKHFNGRYKNHVLVLTDSYSDRDFVIKSRMNETTFPLYNTPDGGLKLPLENRNLPFLFILSRDNKVEKVFLPFKELPDQIDQYLTYCKDYLAKEGK